MTDAGPATPTPRFRARRAWALTLTVGIVASFGLASRVADSASRGPGGVVANYPTVDIASLPVHRPGPEYGPEPPADFDIPAFKKEPGVVTRGALKSGESLGAALRGHGVDASVVHVIDRRMRPIFDFRNSRPGDRYRLAQDADGEIVSFRYSTGPEKVYKLVRVESGFRVDVIRPVLEPRRARIAGVIEKSLYESVRALGEQGSLARDFADLFAWDIDFSRGVQPGDDFQILYERLYRVEDDGFEIYVRPGRILAARFRNSAGEHAAFWFDDNQGGGRYYRADGSSLERAFLAAPLQFSRISSRFTNARHHPILKITRPHYGIDYAAPEGTPIWAVADGTIVFRGWGGSFGNLIKIRHRNGYISYYSHLSGFAKGLRVGQQVSQKQVIGRVGQTGLATGPHVCFRVAKDGRYVDPMRIQSPPGESVSDELWVDFQIVRDTLLSDLDGDTLTPVEEAL